MHLQTKLENDRWIWLYAVYAPFATMQTVQQQCQPRDRFAEID